MCGITITITTSHKPQALIDEQIIKLIRSRGPDCTTEGTHLVSVDGTEWTIAAVGSTLWTQGSSPTRQPLTTQGGAFLLWNGDAYDYPAVQSTLSDSSAILRDIVECVDPLAVLTRIQGPYAFIYYNPGTRSLWFGRDPVGRCSLVIHSSTNHLIISSVLPRNLRCNEVPSHGIFRVSFLDDSFEMNFHPWNDTADLEVQGFHAVDFTVRESIQHAVLNWCKDREQVEPTSQELYSSPNGDSTDPLEILTSLVRSNEVNSAVECLMKLMQDSVQKRVLTKPPKCLNCAIQPNSGTCRHSKVAILFSGGLDCTILALLAHRALELSESIDLLNVAFEKPKSRAADAPDRITGLVALNELKTIVPDRNWNWVEITVGEDELAEKVDHIADLIHPLNSILDESLGCAVWFAARGDGVLESVAYRSPARIVLVGMGADELFGGYSRHAKTFQRSGSWAELDRMLRTEVLNIGARNLGRDNRVVSDHGRMMRVPYLDEALISYVSNLPAWVRCCPSKELPRGVGDKTLLRLFAHTLGLRETAVQPKRALQFGSRIANSKEKGHHTSKKLTEAL